MRTRTRHARAHPGTDRQARGVGHQHALRHFPNKQALLGALYERAKTASVAQLMGADETGQPVKARMRRIWRALLELRFRQPEQQVFMEQYASSEYMSEHNRTLGARLTEVFVALVHQGQDEELLKPIAMPFHQICLLDLSRRPPG